ncbi:related to TUL1 - Golgi-localized RING-finger ubiquitin ligase [Pseudozyma flocculosa]|uniref:RING-type E3 ubiquitin transferase n=1 Tax=Pseudozyma flocculosa TaxID=84751 RepID=A0A5C3FD74_9BASI|nr:related to TUL1 - Golgi-localized RING-finger ubiquitin ligase [Pseudozyma flocculosa]
MPRRPYRCKPPWPTLALLAALITTHAHALLSLFGTHQDPLTPVRDALQQRIRQKHELTAWNTGNTSAMGNWSFTYDTDAIAPHVSSLPMPLDLATPDGAAYYRNLSGFYRGHWAGSSLDTPASAATQHKHETAASLLATSPNASQALIDDRGHFDWFAPKTSRGRLNFNLNQEHTLPGLVSVLRGSLSLEASPSSSSPTFKTSEVDFDLLGLHFLPTGALFLLASPEELDRPTDIRDVLAMIPKHETSINLTVTALEADFDQRIQRLQDIIDSGTYDASSGSDTPSPATSHNCSLHIYAKLRPAGRQDQIDLVETLELEHEHPTGISTISAAPLALSAIAYSPQCQLLLSSDDIDGLTKVRLWRKAVTYALVYFAVLVVQARLLVQQMEATRTPSGLAKVSYRTWGLQSMLDAYIGLAHLSVGIALNNDTTVPLLACAFMSCMLFLAFGYRYALTIYRTQAPAEEALAPAPAPAPTQQAPSVPTAPAGASEAAPAPASGSLSPNIDPSPTAVTGAATQAAPATSSDDIETRRRSFFIFGFIGVLFLSIFFPLLFAELLLPVLYSFWIPQIRRNMRRGTRRAVSTRCVVGTTACRLVLPLYLFACPSNVLFTRPNRLVWVLVAYVVGQMVVLLGQDWFGAHWFVPLRWRPDGLESKWDWHPDIASIEPVEVEGGGAGTSLGDCAICLHQIVADGGERGSSRRSGARRRPKGGDGARRGKRGAGAGHAYSALPDDDEEEEDEDEDEESLSDLEGGVSNALSSSSSSSSTKRREVMVAPDP